MEVLLGSLALSLRSAGDKEDAHAQPLRLLIKPQSSRNGWSLGRIDPGVEDGAVVCEAGLLHLLVVGERGLVDVQHQCQFFLGAAVCRAVAQIRDGLIRLMVQVFGVAAAFAGAFVILLELGLQRIQVGDALAGRVRAHPAGRLRCRLLRNQINRAKTKPENRSENHQLLFH